MHRNNKGNANAILKGILNGTPKDILKGIQRECKGNTKEISRKHKGDAKI